MANPLLSEVRFGAYLVYSPRGQTTASVNSRRVRDAIKRGDHEVLRRIVERLRVDLEAAGLDAVLGPEVTLIPTPRSGLLPPGGLWPGRRLCDELVRAGLGREVVPCLSRTQAVPKSAFQRPGERPTALRHYETMTAAHSLLSSASLTVVDDFVTKGNTALGAATRIATTYPGTSVQVFALVRTMGLQSDVTRIVEPCVGRLRVSREEASRDP